MVLENKAIFLTLKKKKTLYVHYQVIFPSQPVYWLRSSHFSDWGKQNNVCQLSTGCLAIVCAHVFCGPSCSAPRCRRYKLLPHSSLPLFFLFVEVHSIEFTSHSFLQYNFYCRILLQFSSVTQSCPTLRPRESQHARPPCPSPTPRVYPNSCPSNWWCHPAISSSVLPFSSCPQSLPASESFPMSQLFEWGSQSIGVSASASFLPMNTQDWSPLEWTGWISLQYKGLSGVLSNTTVQKHQFFGTQLSSQSNSHIHTWLLEKP